MCQVPYYVPYYLRIIYYLQQPCRITMMAPILQIMKRVGGVKQFVQITDFHTSLTNPKIIF